MIRGYCCCLCGQGLRLTKGQMSKPVLCPTCGYWGTPIPKRLFHPQPLIINHSQNVEPPENEKSLARAALSASWVVCPTILVLFFSLAALFLFNQEFQDLVKHLSNNWQKQ